VVAESLYSLTLYSLTLYSLTLYSLALYSLTLYRVGSLALILTCRATPPPRAPSPAEG